MTIADHKEWSPVQKRFTLSLGCWFPPARQYRCALSCFLVRQAALETFQARSCVALLWVSAQKGETSTYADLPFLSFSAV